MALALAVQAISLRQNAAIPPQHPKQSHTNLHSSSRVEDLRLLLRRARPRGRCRRQLPRQHPRRRLRYRLRDEQRLSRLRLKTLMPHYFRYSLKLVRSSRF